MWGNKELYNQDRETERQRDRDIKIKIKINTWEIASCGAGKPMGLPVRPFDVCWVSKPPSSTTPGEAESEPHSTNAKDEMSARDLSRRTLPQSARAFGLQDDDGERVRRFESGCGSER